MGIWGASLLCGRKGGGWGSGNAEIDVFDIFAKVYKNLPISPLFFLSSSLFFLSSFFFFFLIDISRFVIASMRPTQMPATCELCGSWLPQHQVSIPSALFYHKSVELISLLFA